MVNKVVPVAYTRRGVVNWPRHGSAMPRETKEWWGRNRCRGAIEGDIGATKHVTEAKEIHPPLAREGRQQASAVSGEGGCSRYNAATSSVAARDKPPRPSPKALHAFDPPGGRVNFLTCNYVWKQPQCFVIPPILEISVTQLRTAGTHPSSCASSTLAPLSPGSRGRGEKEVRREREASKV